ncbi:hypothetical protein LRP67_03765 [Nocardioides sp. cx-169]|uniref:hypothetical protein n=1 Tax=Nocardioides sp. cx-169 TaxID=2899080 RepID=UPI001E393EC4|nr:hypothetical protein [Nocardioides sp. cx-169]MCD4533196.1 hypothetical protein [Nocardioides sp. cx-169]
MPAGPIRHQLLLPDGYTQRPLRTSDAAAVTAVMAAQELHDVGWSRTPRSPAATAGTRPCIPSTAAADWARRSRVNRAIAV